jgi:Skp family chaperone for outer membrane proteins
MNQDDNQDYRDEIPENAPFAPGNTPEGFAGGTGAMRNGKRRTDLRLVFVALAVSVISLGLALFLLVSRQSTTLPGTIQPVSLTTADGSTVQGTRVAFVRVDSVQNNYLMTIHFLDSISRRFKSMERDLINRQGDLQKRVQAYYRDIQSGVLQETMALRIKEQIERDGDELATLEENYTRRISDMELQMNIIYFDSLWNFMERNKEMFGVDMVVGYQQGLTNIFFADRALDITTPVIEMLNAEYASRYPARKNIKKGR